jgi:hypothetical protein
MIFPYLGYNRDICTSYARCALAGDSSHMGINHWNYYCFWFVYGESDGSPWPLDDHQGGSVSRQRGGLSLTPPDVPPAQRPSPLPGL